MSNPFVQAAPAIFGSSGTITGSFSSAVAAGDAIIVTTLYPTGSEPSAVSDSINGSYTKLFSAASAVGGGSLDVWAVFNVSGGSPTISINTNGQTLAFALEYVGLTAFDRGAYGSGGGEPGSGGTGWDGQLNTTAQANEVVLAIFGDAQAASGQSWTAGSGCTIRAQAEEKPGTWNLALCVEDQVLTSIPSFLHMTATSTENSVGPVVMMAAFKYTPPTFYSISGNAGVAGATVSYSGTSSGSVTADGSGNFTIPSLINGGTFTITPSLTGYSFSPTFASETLSGANITGVDFTATQLTTATPTFSPGGGDYSSAQSVSLSCSTSGASIYYTLNGTVPTTSSTLYTGPIEVSGNTTINAIAAASGYLNSSEASATYVLQVSTPTFSPSGGTYSGAQTVTISCATSGATIHFTTDNSVPTTSSAVYSSPITVSSSQTVKALAVHSGLTNSAVGSASYVIDGSGDTYTAALPFIGSIRIAGSAPSNAPNPPFLGTVKILESAPAGIPNNYLGYVVAVGSAPSEDSNNVLGQVVAVESAPSGVPDVFLGEILEG